MSVGRYELWIWLHLMHRHDSSFSGAEVLGELLAALEPTHHSAIPEIVDVVVGLRVEAKAAEGRRHAQADRDGRRRGNTESPFRVSTFQS